MSSKQYDVAQICTSGHVINLSCNRQPADCTKFCSLCGSPTIKECPSCKAPIRGDAYVSSVIAVTSLDGVERSIKVIKDYVVPAFCPDCGNPYPWTNSFLISAEKIVDMADDLSPEQKQQLKETFPNLLVDKPESKYSALVASKLIHEIKSMGKNILIEMLKENIPMKLFELMQLD